MNPSRDPDDEAGFTLVELLVVVLIIGVLATIAVPSFFAVRERGWNVTAQTDVRSMSKIATTLQTDGDTPTTLAQLVAAGFDRSPNVSHAICTDLASEKFAVAARHNESTAVYLVDFEGRLVESAGGAMTAALTSLSGCELSEVDP